MKKKNGFIKPEGVEVDIQKTFSAIVSSSPQNPKIVQHLTKRIREIGKEMNEKRKQSERRLIKR